MAGTDIFAANRNTLKSMNKDKLIDAILNSNRITIPDTSDSDVTNAKILQELREIKKDTAQISDLKNDISELRSELDTAYEIISFQ